MTPLFKVFHFEGYMRRKTVFIGFDYRAADEFVRDHGRSLSPNGCYIATIYPKRIAA